MEFSERYDITHRIGSGGVGVVYKATDRSLGRRVAIKRLLPQEESEDSGKLGSDLLKEARALSSFQHPNIVTVYDAGEDEDGLYIVMELLKGGTLDTAIEVAPLDLASFATIATETLEGLVAAHDRHILHRDLKPSNLYLHNLPSGGFQAKLLDFGLAKASVTPTLQTVDHTKSILGSIYFLAPEQFERKPLDHRTDLYQLGCLFFYSLTSRYPFDGKTTADVMQAHFENTPRDLAALRPDLPAALCTWLLWHLNLSPGDRPASAQQSLETLQSVLAGNPAPDVPQPGTRPPSASTTKVPLRRPATSSPVPTPSTATQAYLAKVAAKSSPVATAAKTASQSTRKPKKKAKPKSRNAISVATGIWIAVVFLMLVAFAGIAYHAIDMVAPAPEVTESPQLPDPPTDPVNPGQEQPGATPPAPAKTPALVHLDADKATFTDAATTPAKPGDRVAHWADSAPEGGDNPAQYHVTDHKNPPSRWPLLKAGAAGRHLEFDGRRNLLVGRSGDGAGDPLGPALDKKAVTLVVRFLARPPKKPDGATDRRFLTGLRVDNNKRTLDTFIRDGKLHFGFIGHPDRNDRSQQSVPLPGGAYTVAFATADPAFRTLLLETWTPDGKKKTSTSPVDSIEPFSKIREIRIGGPGISSGQPGMFVGEISDVMLFARPLDENERRKLAKQLHK